ncbi:mucin-19-like [Schistocerca americana]|uniref:mucin-19-like n=1 Tax=Schistocerca americana TaxID=7009 RepID=UPI001F4F40F4|nr:mucin-19-like [Schistocerca americana]
MNLRASVLTTVWVLVAVTAVDASPVGDCPPVDALDHTDHLPDSKNCSLFYKCDHAAPVLFICPDGLHFNPVLEVCDWPDRAGCSGASPSTVAPSSSSAAPTSAATTAAPTAAPSSTDNPTSAPSGDCPAVGTCPQYEDENSIAKHLPHATNCSQFCKCDHGKPVTFDCPAGLHFNPTLEVCDWPDQAGCSGGSASTAAPSSSTAAPTSAATTSAPTAAPSSSTAAPTSAATTAAPTAAPSSTANPTPAPSGDCPAVGTCPQYEDENSIAKHLPHATNCSQFCKCDHGKHVTFDCPAGLHFNPTLEVCDWPDQAGCSGGSASTAAPSSSTAAPTSAATTAAPTAAPSSSTAAPTSAATTAAPTAAPSSTANPTSAPSDDCPAVGTCPQYEDENSIAKHLPHATNCSQFCKCDHGKPVTFDCPAGLHFNPTLEVCDWPDQAGCSAPSSTANPTPAPSGDCPAVGTCPQYEDENSIAKHLPHATNCSQFCKCDHGKPVTFDCPAGLHFNPTLEVCDWPDQAGCSGGSASTAAPSSSTAAPTSAATTAAPTAAPSSSTAAPTSAATTGAPTAAPSSSTAAPTSAATTAAPTAAPSSTANPTPAPSGDCPAVGTCPQYEDENSIAKHLPHATNCSQFCKCDHGKPVTFDCPAGLHFNPTLEVCDWPDQAGCSGGSASTAAPSSSTAAPTSAATTAAPTAAPSSSTAAPTSAATTAAPTAAPSSTANPTSAPSDDCPAVGTCPQYEDENSIAKHLPHATNCSQFCKCDHGKPVTFDCPAGLHFNPTLEVCDWPDQAGCSAPSSTANPTPAPSGDCPAVGTCPQYEDENSIAKHLPHATNCSQFCKCDHGKPVTFDCPAGLHFNPTLEVCDWPDQAGCSGGSASTAAPSSSTAAPTSAATTAAPTAAPSSSTAAPTSAATTGAPTAAPSSSTAAPTSAATTAAPTAAPSSTANPTPAPSGDCPAVGTCPQYEDENSIAKHLPHATNCSQFCKCDHGKPVTFDCPAGLHFNPTLEVCDWPDQAGCSGGSASTAAPSSSTAAPTSAATTAAPTAAPSSSTAAPTSAATTAAPTAAPSSSTAAPTSAATTAAPTVAPSSTANPTGDCPAVGSCPQYEDENSIAKHLPHSSDCTKFCKCDHGTPVTFDCPAGLHFNPTLEVCDWPYRAGCVNSSA